MNSGEGENTNMQNVHFLLYERFHLLNVFYSLSHIISIRKFFYSSTVLLISPTSYFNRLFNNFSYL